MTDKSLRSSNLARPIIVSNQDDLSGLMAHLTQQTLIALDTESDSLFSYYTKVCLIQISTCQDGEIVDYLLDPLTCGDISALGTILADPNIEIIMHAAYNDILTLQREYDFAFKHIFDTQLTARILGWRRTGLATVLEEHFGVVSDKKMQLANWGERPLTERQQIYAQMDTHYLFELRRIQLAQLAEKDRFEEANEAFEQLAWVNFHDRPAQEKTFWQMRAARDVPRDKTGVLEAVWNWREEMAQKMDRPPFKVMNDAALVTVATATPKDEKGLHQLHALSQHQIRRFGKSLLRAVQHGASQPLPKPPAQKSRPDTMLDDETVQRYEALRSWRTQTAEARGVDPDIVFSNDTLLSIAKRTPQSIASLQEIAEIGPWKAKTYGPDLIDLVANN